MKQQAALYLRSSKDRHDVSIDAQRRRLREFAKSLGLTIVEEHKDVVESAKTEHRPAFQRVLIQLKDPRREWSHLLMLDTSRLSRRRYVAQAFKHEAKKRGVEIHFANLPDVDPVSRVILESVLEAMDEVHSLMSRDKGLAGMAENVRQGYRAGGRAPRGYMLERVATGALREGEAVTKSRLKPGPEAGTVRDYLLLRVAGASRLRAKAQSGIEAAATSLIAIEWNALTYAGHTVWNQRAPIVRGEGYKGGKKYRPREEWVIQKGTHEPLISDHQAETLLTRLLNNPWRHTRRTKAVYLLTGLLRTPDSFPWHGEGRRYYRVKKKRGGHYVSQKRLERAVLDQVIADLNRDKFIKDLAQRCTDAVKDVDLQQQSERPGLEREASDLDRRIDHLLGLTEKLPEEDIAPIVRKIGQIESDRQRVLMRLEILDQKRRAAASLTKISEGDIRALLKDFAQDLGDADREVVKDTLERVVDQIELHPETLEARICYRVDPSSRISVASRRGSVTNPVDVEDETQLRLRRSTKRD